MDMCFYNVSAEGNHASLSDAQLKNYKHSTSLFTANALSSRVLT